jgi:2,4-dienoyl-CoA reductase-like NADH-dependent reductase (Old Yellow Enzyme family)
MTVGLILDPKFAEDVLQAGQADLIAIGREALYNPNWAVHAARSLGVESEFSFLPEQYGWWLDRRQKQLDLSLEAPAAKAG